RRHTRFSRDWSSDVCSSDLERLGVHPGLLGQLALEQPGLVLEPLLDLEQLDEDLHLRAEHPGVEGLGEVVDRPGGVAAEDLVPEIGRASCREGVEMSAVAGD